MSVTLQHRRKQMLPYQLDHAHYCAALGRCECTTIETQVYVRKPAPGLRSTQRLAPAVLTLDGNEKRTGLPDAILLAPDIAAAVKRGDIRAITVPEFVPSAPPAAPAPITFTHTNSAPARTRK